MICSVTSYLNYPEPGQNENGREIRKLTDLETGEARFVGHAVRLRREPGGRTIRLPFHFNIPGNDIAEAYRNWDAAIAPVEEAVDAQLARQAEATIQRVPAEILNRDFRLATKPGRG